MRKIKLDSKITVKNNTDQIAELNLSAHDYQSIETKDDDIQSLLKANPAKLLYSISETAKVLGVSYEFVRARVYGQQVNIKQFGSRKLIHISELSRLISEGLPS